MALYHSAKGSVDYTTVGAPTIVDGIASGFSSSPKSYLKTSSSFPNWNDINELDISIKTMVTTKNKYGLVYHMGNFSLATGGGASIFMVYIPGQNRYDIPYSENTYYNIRVNLKDNVWSIYVNNVLKKTYELTSQIIDTTSPFGFGNTYTGAASQGFQGAIDLNKTYIKVNGQPWFGICPVEVQKHQIMGPVGYTEVGSPTIADGIMSNFSNSNYATTTSAFEVANYDNVEIYIRAKTPVTTSAGWTDIIENGGAGSYRNLGAYANNEMTSYYFNFFGYDFWRYQISEDTWYRLKLTTTANTQSGYIYDDNGNLLYQSENSARRIAGTSVLSFGGRYSPNKIGAIDFNNTYIKVNGKMWFYQPANTKYIVKDGRLVWADQNLYLLNTKNGGGYAGNSVYFNSGFVPTNKTTYEVMFDRIDSTDGSGETNCALFGINAAVYNNTNYEGFRVILQNRLDCIYFGTQAIGTISNATLKNGKRKVIKSYLGSNYVVTLTQNGTMLDMLTFNTVSDQTCFGNLYLGCYNYGYSDGRNPIPYYPFLGKIYYAKFWENGVLIRHFVPVPAGLVIGNFTVPSNGMFDIVNQQFYANQGRGEFTIGRDE